MGGRRVELLADTGSAVTTLTPEAADRARLDRGIFTGRRVVFTAAGTSIIVPTGRVPTLRIGIAELNDVEVAPIGLPTGVDVDGLLGVNVLDRFRATFDFRHATLILRAEPLW